MGRSRPSARRAAFCVLAVALSTACGGTAPQSGTVAAPRAPATAASSSTPVPPTTSGPTASPSTTSPPVTSPSRPLQGRVVVLDPGHNGGNAAHPAAIRKPVPAGGFRKPCNTVGTATEEGYPEHAFTWDLARRAARLLRAQGATVVLTRDGDDGVGPCVDRRARVASARRADLAVSLHADGGPPTARGFHVIMPAAAPDGGNRAVLDDSARAARALLGAFGDATGARRAIYPGGLVAPGLARRDDLAGLNLARVPTVFLEAGNMRNRDDAAHLSRAAWRQRAAQGVADGVAAFLVTRS